MATLLESKTSSFSLTPVRDTLGLMPITGRWQATIGGFIMDRQRPPQRSCRVLCIQGTGKGKSILNQTLAAHFTGVGYMVGTKQTSSKVVGLNE